MNQGWSSMELDIESIDEALATTRSVRRRLDLARAVPMALIEECIDVAAQAPVSLAGEAFRFLLVTDDVLKASIAALYEEVLEELNAARGSEVKSSHRTLAANIGRMPLLIFVYSIGKPGVETAHQVAFYGSVLPAAWSLMVALRARGFGSTWTTLLSAREKEVARLLHVPEDVTQTVMLPVAWARGARLRRASRLPARQLIAINRWHTD
jgi:nitroreductase